MEHAHHQADAAQIKERSSLRADLQGMQVISELDGTSTRASRAPIGPEVHPAHSVVDDMHKTLDQPTAVPRLAAELAAVKAEVLAINNLLDAAEETEIELAQMPQEFAAKDVVIADLHCQ
jgi:hypothetical protein